MGKGFLISFEGTDGCGKSTQIRILQRKLESLGYRVLVSREPGGTAAGEKIRALLLKKTEAELCPLCELLLFEAARAQHMQEVVLPALEENKVVILDRFVDSTFAYQGVARGLGEQLTETLNGIAAGDRMPQLTVLLELPPAQAFRRKGGAERNDRMEAGGETFFRMVREGYRKAAQAHPDRIAVIDAQGSREETAGKIFDRVTACMEGKKYART